ncbi:cytochrome P450 family protein [Streptomyces puniciscabiei]
MPEQMTDLPDLPSPFGAADAADPYPSYDRLRASGGMRRIRIRPGLEPWLVSRYEDVRDVLGDERLSTDPATTTEEVRAAIRAGRAEEQVALLGRNLLSVDPPDHTRMRRVMSRALSARRTVDLEKPVTRLADELLDELGRRGEGDLLADYTLPLAVSVICRIIGIPEEDHARFRTWGRALVRAELEDMTAFDRVSDEMAEYFVPFILGRRHSPRDDLVSVLASARDDDRLDDHELISLVYQLFFAGHESSAYFMANAVLTLLRHPAELARLRANPELLPGAIEELLRYEGSVKVPTWRFAKRDLVIAGAAVAQGEPVLALLASAGRDPGRHPDGADELRIDRADTAHLAFSHGIHHCMGSAVGRLESRIAVSRLLDRFPNLRLAVPEDALRWRVNLMMRGVCELPVTLGRPAS